MQTLEALHKRIETTEDMGSIVGTMKTLAAVSIQQFVPTETAVVLNGSAQNIGQAESGGATLVFEFLDGAGQVVATHNETVPALPSRGQHSISIRADVSGAVGWRYKKQ